MMNRLHDCVSFFGVLRLLLIISAIVLVIAAPAADGPIHATGLSLVRSVITPSLFVIMLFILPLDFVMTLVFMFDRQGPDRRRLRIIALTEAGLFIVLCMAWAPFLFRVLKVLD